MFDRLIAFSLRQKGLILLLTLAMAGIGVNSFVHLPIDAVPDITNNQVQVLTSAPAMSALEIERYVTFPIESALKSLPDLVELRSLSRSSLSVVTIVFHDDVDIYFARQQVLEKLREAEEAIPDGVERPELAPVSTGLGEIFRYVLRDTTGRLSPMDLRTVQDWIVRRELLGTPGVAEVNSLGGYVRQYHVLVNPEALVAYRLTLRDLFDAVAGSSGNAGGAYIETGPEQLVVRSVGLATSPEEIAQTVIRTSSDGTPVLLSDVATVDVGHALRFGSSSQDGEGEVVTGITMQLKGANARVTVDAVKERIAAITPSLPDGVVIEPYYDREVLVNRTIRTVIMNLAEGALLVIFILLLFLVNLRAGLIVASVIPLSMLFGGTLLYLFGGSGNLMSLGAIDFGLVVDGSLIIVENCLRLLDERRARGTPSGEELHNLVLNGSIEVRKAAQFGELIIIVVYLPILTLQGIEGKLFTPMAMMVVFTLVGALILSLTYVPVMVSLFLTKAKQIRHSPLIAWMKRIYEPSLRRAIALRIPILGGSLLLLIAAVIGFSQMGGEFIPRLDEGDIAMHIIRLPSVSLTESQKITTRIEKELMTFPEVRTVVSSTGRAEISTDPMGVELADAFVMLHPRDEWEEEKTKEELIEEMEERLEDIPGAGVQFLQPIEMRMNELIAGARGDVVIKVTGDDYDVMTPAAEEIAQILRQTDGGSDITLEQTAGLPQLVVRPRRPMIARYGLTVADLNNAVATSIGGQKATEVAEGEQRIDVVVRVAEEGRDDINAIRNLLIPTPEGLLVRLNDVADVEIEDGPAQISREDGSRFVTIQANVRGRDVQSFVEEVQEKVEEQIELPAGYGVHYGGAFENLEGASRRLMIVVPIALLLIFLLLVQTFRSVRLGLLIFLCVPMGLIGGVASLMIAGLPFSISAGVGFIALFGIAVLNGIVMVASFRKHHEEDRMEGVIAAAMERLRPVITTAALAGFGFVPMMLAHGAGAEVQRPLATVIVGGLISSTILTLYLLPILYHALGEKRESRSVKQAGSGGSLKATILLVLLLSPAAAGLLHAQTPLTREIVRERTIANGPEIARSMARTAERRGEQRAAGILPPLEVRFGADESTSPLLTGDANYAFELEQRFHLPGYYSSRSRLNDLLIRQGELGEMIAERDLIRAADLAWLDLVATTHLLLLADSAVELASAFATRSERRHQLGETTRLDALQGVLGLTRAERERLLLLRDQQSAAAHLRTLTGSLPDAEMIPAERLLYHPLNGTRSELEEKLLQNHPLLQSAEIDIEAAKAGESVVRAEKLPDISIGYGLQSIDGGGPYYTGGITVGLPIWNWMNDGAEEAARSVTAVREQELAILRRDLLLEFRRRYAAFSGSAELVAIYNEHLLPQASEAYALALRLFDEGEATWLEIMTAQANLLAAERDYAELLWMMERERIELEYLIGEGV